jgi:hypothetical protein
MGLSFLVKSSIFELTLEWNPVAADMVAMGVGIDNEADSGEIDA